MPSPWRWPVAIVITVTLISASAGYSIRQRKAARFQSAAIRQDKQVYTSPQVTRTTCIGGITYMWVQEGIYVSLTPKWEVVAANRVIPGSIPGGSSKKVTPLLLPYPVIIDTAKKPAEKK